jgi:hypothetical protein
MRRAFTKAKSTCYVFVKVKLMGFLSLLGKSKFESDRFSECKSQVGVYHFSHSVTLKMTCRTHVQMLS